jgi:hypothetical protein
MTDRPASAAARPAVAKAAVAILTVVLYAVSRGKWSDPIIDSGREWIVPDALSRGGLLYRDVVYWFGPLTPYIQSAFFRMFGSSFASLVLAGAAGSVVLIAVFQAALRVVVPRREAWLWTALAIPALVFMPNAGGSLLGMGFRIWHAATLVIAAIALAATAGPKGRASRLLVAGVLAGLAGLCRTEWGLAGVGAVGLARIAGADGVRRALRDAVLVSAGWAAAFGAGLSLFLASAGWDAVVRDGHVLLTGLPRETKTFFAAYAGFGDWKRGLLQMAYSSAMWLGGFLAVDLAARPRAQAFRAIVPVGVVLAVTALLGGATGAVLFSAAPLVCALALLLALAVAGRSPRRRHLPSGMAAVGFAAAGLVLSYRRPVHIGDAAYVGPPLLFAFLSAATLVRAGVRRAPPGPERRRLRLAVPLGLAVLVACAFGGRIFQYASDDRVPIPGTEGMLTARPAVASQIQVLAQRIRAESEPGEGLVSFPEGEVMNYVADRRNPIRHKLYIPGYLTDENEETVLAELEAAPPRFALIWTRPTGEYGRSFFGEDYGAKIRRWLDANYEVRKFDPRTSGRRVVVYRRR